MNILEARVDFTSNIYPGRLSYILHIDNTGVNINIDELVEKVINYGWITIRGDRLYMQKEELVKFIKKVSNQKKDIIVEIYTLPKYKPVIFNNVTVFYNVNILLKNSGISFEERINKEVILQYMQLGANFIFIVKNDDDVDEVNLIVKDIGIKKDKIFLSPPSDIGEIYLDFILQVITYAKLNGYNFCFDIYNIYWRDHLNGQRTNN